MEYAPICIATLNRSQHLQACIESLKKNAWAKFTELYIALDFPPSEEYRGGYESVSELLEKGIDGFRCVNIIKRDINYGCEKNFNDLIEQVLIKHNCFIAMEDDCVVAPDFIEYMDKCLDYFKDDPRVQSVSGYTRYELYAQKSNVVLTSAYSAWGHGMWKTTYYQMKEEVSIEHFEKYVKSFRCLNNLKRFKSKRVFSRYMDMMLDGYVPFWDTSFSIWLQMNDFYQVRPLETKVVNRGNDATALHSQAVIPELQQQEFKCINNNFELCVCDDLFDKKILKKNNNLLFGPYKIKMRKYLIFVTYQVLGRRCLFGLMELVNKIRKR